MEALALVSDFPLVAGGFNFTELYLNYIDNQYKDKDSHHWSFLEKPHELHWQDIKICNTVLEYLKQDEQIASALLPSFLAK